MYGKEIIVPRRVFSYGNEHISYTYTRKTEKSVEWTTFMKKMRDLIFKMCQKLDDENETFNFVLINKYMNENDYIGAHSDNEEDIIPESHIASLSVGENRQFSFISKNNNEKKSIILKSVSLLLMMGKTQQLYKHELPKSKSQCDVRYNLTFRHLKNN